MDYNILLQIGIAYLLFETNGNVKIELIPAGTGIILLSTSYASR